MTASQAVVEGIDPAASRWRAHEEHWCPPANNTRVPTPPCNPNLTWQQQERQNDQQLGVGGNGPAQGCNPILKKM